MRTREQERQEAAVSLLAAYSCVRKASGRRLSPEERVRFISKALEEWIKISYAYQASSFADALKRYRLTWALDYPDMDPEVIAVRVADMGADIIDNWSKYPEISSKDVEEGSLLLMRWMQIASADTGAADYELERLRVTYGLCGV